MQVGCLPRRRQAARHQFELTDGIRGAAASGEGSGRVELDRDDRIWTLHPKREMPGTLLRVRHDAGESLVKLPSLGLLQAAIGSACQQRVREAQALAVGVEDLRVHRHVNGGGSVRIRGEDKVGRGLEQRGDDRQRHPCLVGQGIKTRSDQRFLVRDERGDGEPWLRASAAKRATQLDGEERVSTAFAVQPRQVGAGKGEPQVAA